MAKIEATHRHDSDISQANIDMSTLSNVKDFGLRYQEKEDTLFIRPDKPRPAVSFDWNGEFWLRFDPKTGEIVGIEINDFESVFLKKHPELAQLWYGIRPSSHRLCKLPRTVIEDTIDSEPFSKMLFNFFTTFFRRNPCQVGFS